MSTISKGRGRKIGEGGTTPPGGGSSGSGSNPSNNTSKGSDTSSTESRSGSPNAGAGSSPNGTGRGRTQKTGVTKPGDIDMETMVKKTSDLKVVDMMKRPGFGTMGQRAPILGNFFELRVAKELNVSQYHLEISHTNAKLTRDEKRLVFFACVHSFPQVFKNRFGLGFDGDHLAVSLEKLKAPDQPQEGAFTLGVTIRIPRFEKEDQFNIRFQLVGLVHLSTRNVNVASSATERYTTPLQVFDVLIRMMRSAGGDAARFWYPFKSTVYRMPDQGYGAPLGVGLAIIQGLFGATRVGQNFVPYINFDVSHSGFYKPQMTMELMLEILNERFSPSGRKGQNYYTMREMGPSTVLRPEWLSAVNKEFKGLKVVSTVRRANGEEYEREFRVNAVSALTGVTKSFETKGPNGETRKFTVAEYFKTKYGGIRYPSLNLLHVGPPKKDTFLPMERCRIAPNQRVAKKLTPDQTSVMIKSAAISAPNRRDKIYDLVNQCHFEQDPYLQAFGLQISKEMKQITSRVLPAPSIQYAPNTRPVEPRDGVWDCRNQKFSVPALIPQVGALVIDDVQDQNTEGGYLGFFRFLLQTCGSFGMRGNTDVPKSLMRVLYPNADLKEVQPSLQKLVDAGCKLIIVVIPAKNSPYYSEVKKAAEIYLGVMTQCVCKSTVIKTMQKMDRMTATNITLKINTKLGGINSQVTADAIAKKVLLEQPTLVLGIDVTHPSATENRTPSIASVVGNLDDTFMRYAASIRVQKHRREAMVHLQAPVKDRLIEYFTYVQKANQELGQNKPNKPQRLIIFRDGVAEGQFQEVMREELSEIRNACKAMDEKYKPKITFIVAQKRHHARFFPTSQQTSCGRAMNVRPGTVVDTDITHPDQFEYYLCSHFGIQGTSRPIRYHVLVDENNFTADQLQVITYYMCHMYARCTRSVSIPAPIYYADLACRRARIHLYDKIQDFGSDTMSSRSGTNADASAQSFSSEEEFTKQTTLKDELKLRMYFT